MAKTNVVFNNKNYSIDNTSLFSATSALKSHLSTVMNGSGAVISLDGTSYNIDSAKLTTARSAFVSHLGTIAGNGHKVVVSGVEYSVDSAKMIGAIADLHAVLGNLSSGAGDDTGDVLDNTLPIEYNTKEVSANTSVIFNGNKFVRVSNLVPTVEELQKCKFQVSLDNNVFVGTYSAIDASSGAIYAIYTTQKDGMSFSAHVCVVPAAGEYAGVAIPHAGIYVIDMWQAFGYNADISMGIDNANNYTEVVMAEREIDFSYGEAAIDYIGLIAGKTYKVLWDGVEYEDVARNEGLMGYDENDIVIIGNSSYVDAAGKSTNHPFVIADFANVGGNLENQSRGYCIAILDEAVEESEHTVAIYQGGA